MKGTGCGGGVIVNSTVFGSGACAVSQSATVNALRHIHVSTTGSAVYVKFGDNAVTATKGTSGETLIPQEWIQCFTTTPVQTTVAVIEDHPSAVVSVTEIG